MKKAITCLLAVLLTMTALPAPPVDKIEKADPDQKAQIQELENRMLELRKDIEGFYKHLKAMGKIKKGEVTPIQMTANLVSRYGTSRRDFVNEEAVINWREGEIVYMFFEQRVIRPKTFMKTRKRWYVRELSKPSGDGKAELDGISVNVMVEEVLSSSSQFNYNFRLFTGADLRDNDRDIEPPIEATRGVRDLQIVYVDKVRRRIALLREYTRLMTLLKRRIEWLIRHHNHKQDEKVDEFLESDDY